LVVIAGRQLDENFCILPLSGEGNPVSKPQDVPNSKDVFTVYYRHRLAGNNVGGKMWIQSSISQMKHATSSFKQYLLKDRIPGSHPAFSFGDSMCEAIKEQMPTEYTNVELALFPKTIYYTRSSDGVRMSTSGVSLQVTKQAACQVDTTGEDIEKMWQKLSAHRGGPLK
jgi:hypothetical protein